MLEQKTGEPAKPRRLLWLWITLLVLVSLLGGVLLAFSPLRQVLFPAQVASHLPATATPGGPWYLTGGGPCVRLSTLLPKQISNIRVSNDTYFAHSEPEIAENPLNPLDLVGGSKFFKTQQDAQNYKFQIGYYSSTDGGCTWKDGGLLPGFDPIPDQTTSDISFAFGLHNDAYAAVLVSGKTGNSNFSGIAVSRSTDGGRTFDLPVYVQADPTGATFSDKPWIGVDTTPGPFAGSVYVVWNLDSNTANSAPIYFSRSTDDGKTFSPGREIDGTSTRCQFGMPTGGDGARTCDSALGATPVISPDDTLSVVYAYVDPNLSENDKDQGGGQNQGAQAVLGGQSDLAACTTLPPSDAAHTQMMVVQSRDGGLTWSEPVDAATVYDLPFHFRNSCFRNFSLPAFAADPTSGNLYLSWSDERNGDADILLVRSTDGGKTWSAPVRVNDDPLGDGKDQFQPQLVVAPNGVISVMFFDRRNDPNNFKIDAYLAQSTNGGQTFHRNARVTNVSWDPSLNPPIPRGGPPVTFIGDYQGLAVDNHFAHVFWNDTRTGKQEIFTAAMPSVQPAS